MLLNKNVVCLLWVLPAHIIIKVHVCEWETWNLPLSQAGPKVSHFFFKSCFDSLSVPSIALLTPRVTTYHQTYTSVLKLKPNQQLCSLGVVSFICPRSFPVLGGPASALLGRRLILTSCNSALFLWLTVVSSLSTRQKQLQSSSVLHPFMQKSHPNTQFV